jgi:hypothetical protein
MLSRLSVELANKIGVPGNKFVMLVGQLGVPGDKLVSFGNTLGKLQGQLVTFGAQFVHQPGQWRADAFNHSVIVPPP